MCSLIFLSLSQLLSNVICLKRNRFEEANRDLLLISIVKHMLTFILLAFFRIAKNIFLKQILIQRGVFYTVIMRVLAIGPLYELKWRFFKSLICFMSNTLISNPVKK